MITRHFYAMSIFRYLSSLGLLSLLLTALSCTPRYAEVDDTRHTSVSQISKVVLKLQNSKLVADGKARMDLTPLIYVKSGETEGLILRDRIQDDWLEYSISSGEVSSGRYFSTTDAGLIGKEVSVKVKIKGTSLESNSCTFTVMASARSGELKTIPIVFHLFREEGAEYATGIRYGSEFFDVILDRLNNVFSGKLSFNPVGVDTHIRFAPALYDINGNKLEEKGIHRITLPKGSLSDHFRPDQVVTESNALWDPQHYLNIWLFPKNNVVQDPASSFCAPGYVLPPISDVLPGLSNPKSPLGPIKEYHEGATFDVFHSGIFYQVDELRKLPRQYSFMYGYMPGYNDLTHYLGIYFGLLKTNPFKSKEPAEDYCDDTVGYYEGDDFYGSNRKEYKETPAHFFLSENIMDDPTGFHVSVSKSQAERIHWVCEHCPDRFSWKSSYAFTGKK